MPKDDLCCLLDIRQSGEIFINRGDCRTGERSFEIVALVRTWRGNSTSVSPRAVALRSANEGAKPGEVDFFSAEAAAALRPRLRLTYVPQTSFGLP